MQVHGLREKISYLENALVSQKKLAQPPPEPPAGKGKNQKVAATAHHDNAQSMKQPQLQQSGFQENFMKKQSTNISVSPSRPLEGVP